MSFSPVILTVNRSDVRGGAATVANNLHSSYKRLGYPSYYAVQFKTVDDPTVLIINNAAAFGPWRRSITSLKNSMLARMANWRGVYRLSRIMEWLADPAGKIKVELGIEEFHFPGSLKLLDLTPEKPNLVHAHVLHGGFFDLRSLNELSSKVAVFITLHDAWMLSGHCAHSFDCERWITGCGRCPDLTIPKAIKRDNSAFNWKQKRRIYKGAKFYVSTPCQWLMDKVNKSILAEGAVEKRVVPYGVNQEVFFPADRKGARRNVEIQEDAFVFLFSANGIRKNRWKDFELMKAALTIAAAEMADRDIVFLALGENGQPERIGNSNAEICFRPFRSDPAGVADFYRAADVYLHAAKADTFPNAVLEALSCGVPVIATGVGGIPEQVKGWDGFSVESGLNTNPADRATGILVSPGDAPSFAKAMLALLRNEGLRNQLATNAASDARTRYPIHKQTQAYLDWYKEVLTKQDTEK